MALEIEIVAKAAEVSQAVGPTSMDPPAWIQAISSMVAVLAVAAVAWLEHRRAVEARAFEAKAKHERDLAEFLVFEELLLRGIQTWFVLRGYSRRLNRGMLNLRFGFASKASARTAAVIERLLAGRVLSVDALLMGAEIVELVRSPTLPILETDEPTPADRKAVEQMCQHMIEDLVSALLQVKDQLEAIRKSEPTPSRSKADRSAACAALYQVLSDQFALEAKDERPKHSHTLEHQRYLHWMEEVERQGFM